jgi:hypothetical protein
MRRISGLVGLDGVRRSLTKRLGGLARLRASGKPTGVLANVIFTGRDGCGRRAVAALYARALAELGVNVTGALDWVPLSEFPARWPGQAEAYAATVFGRAQGGLLFLEADLPFAERAPEERAYVFGALPGAVSRNQGVTLVLSGDPGFLGEAIAATAGLAECFAEHLPFAEYTDGQLAELTARYLTSRGHALEEGISDALTGFFGQAPEGIGAWEAHRVAGYLSEFASGQVITTDDLSRLADDGEASDGEAEEGTASDSRPAEMAVQA